MGGLDSEIVEDTSSLTLESATFDASSVRKSSSRLAHRTDASQRYEKSLDPELTVAAIERFVKILSDWDEGIKITSSVTDEYAFKYDKVTLTFDKRFVDKYTGIEISNDTIVSTLTALGFGVKLENDTFTVDVPSWRATKDVTLKADIIEEITRIYGYDNFNVNTTVAPLFPVRAFLEKTTDEQVKDILVKAFGLHEVHSYIWAYTDEQKKLGIEIEENIKLLNATNPNIETIRKSMVPNQLCQVKGNTSYASDFGVFEIARVVNGLKENGMCNEEKKLCVTLYSKTKSVTELYYELAGILSYIVDDIKHQTLVYTSVEPKVNYIHPRNYNEIACGGVVLGNMGIVHPTVAKKIDKRASIVFLEIDMNKLVSVPNLGIHYVEAPKYPTIDVDVTFVCNKYEPISKAVKEVNSPLIKKEAVVDTYEDENGKSITARLTFMHPDRTLTKDEVMEIVDKIIAILKSQGIEMKQ